MTESSELSLENVADPELVWIEDSCYRVNGVNKLNKNLKLESNTSQIKLKPYVDNEEANCENTNDFDIEITENGKYLTSIELPHVFYSYIIGTKGFRRKKLEEETKTEINVPRHHSNRKILIKGQTERSVVLCRNRLEMIGMDLRNKHQITHFISIPMTSEEIKQNFLQFQESILSEGHIDGVDNSIFQKVDKIHLTIGVLVLLDNVERDEASQMLESCKREVILPLLTNIDTLILKMKGLEYMNDDPSHVDVLYAKVKVENSKNRDILQKISDEIVNYFSAKGLMKNDSEYVKLHATLMNTRYRKDSDSDGSGSRSRDRKRSSRIAFDARQILKKYKDFDFGQQKLESIHLSHRFSVDKDGYYEPVYITKLFV